MGERLKTVPNIQLKRERELRGWSQKDVAEKIDTDAFTVNRWERGITFPSPHFRQKLCELFNKNASELGLMSKDAAPLLMHSLIWNIPFGRNPFFTGREDIIKRLHDTFTAGKVSFARKQTISGLPGIGKTQTAIEYAYRFRDEYQAILWARAETHETLISDFGAIAELLNVPEKNVQDQRGAVENVKQWLSNHTDWLLILDNVEELSDIHDFIPHDVKGHILLTTQTQYNGLLARGIDLEKMDIEEGMLFLLRRAKRIAHDASLDDASPSDHIAAKDVYQVLDGLPLALDQAGSFIEETACSLSGYLSRFQQQRAQLLELRSGIGGMSTDHPESVRATFSLSFELVERTSPTAADLLRFCAFLYPDAIPEELIIEGAPELGLNLQIFAANPLKVDETITELRKYSLVRRNPDTKSLTIHRLIQAVLKDNMEEEVYLLWAERTVKAVNRTFPEVEFTTWQRCQLCLPHAQACASLIEQCSMAFVEAAQLLNHVGYYLIKRAEFTEAEPLLQKALEICEQVMGPMHPDTISILDTFANFYSEQGMYNEAEPFLQQALIICEQMMGQHPTTARILSHLAALYEGEGEYNKAELRLQSALAIYIQQLGSQHPMTADILSRLGYLYFQLDKNVEAEPLLQQALEIYEQQLGPHHPTTIYTISRLAAHYSEQGKEMEAEQLYQRVETLYELQLEVQHPDMGHSLESLANFYSKQGRNNEAELLLRRALTIYEQQLGSHHPTTTNSLNNLAFLYEREGKYLEADTLLHRALTIYEQRLGQLHPTTILTLSHLGSIYSQQNKHLEAKSLLQRALVICEQQLGSHPITAYTLNCLAALYEKEGKYGETESFVQRALVIYEQLSPQSFDTGQCLAKIARLYLQQGKEMDAEPLLLRALAIYGQQLGLQHPDTVYIIDQLASIYERLLKTECSNKVYILNNLAIIYQIQDKFTEAESLLESVKELYEQRLKIQTLFQPTQMITYQIYRGHSNTVWAAAWSPNSKHIASASEDNTVCIWDTTSGNILSTCHLHSWVETVAWSPDGRRIASGSHDNMVHIWDVTTSRRILTYRGHAGPVYSVAWSPDGKHITSASEDTTVHLWDALSGNQIHVYENHSANANAVTWSHNGKYLASASNDTTVHVWNASNKDTILVYRGHAGPVYSVAWSPDGKYIASAGADGNVHIWDAIAGSPILIYRAHDASIHTVVWSPNGQSLASGSDDSTIHIFDAATGTQLASCNADSGRVLAMSWSPNQQYIVSGGDDMVVQVWQML